ncbi:MAG: ribonuclease R, partial [Bacteroidota bacterium]|nr:ribonuclease R [Bacteroidota bacterium]
MGQKNIKKHDRKKGGKNLSEFKGKLEITRSGMGFVVVEGQETDILVRPSDFNTAMHGDIVRVRIKEENGTGRRKQGIVSGVAERKQSEFVGRLQMNKGFAFFVADGDKKSPDIFIHEKSFNGATDADRVVVRVKDWSGENGKRPVGEVVSILNPDDANDMAMKEILLEAGFPIEFPDDVMEEANRIPVSISEAEIKKRNDFREVLTFTIDPVDAKDFDDAISIKVLKNGNYEIGVHIADVSHFVESETALDEFAYKKATSVYLPDRVNPMLPEQISNVLCSLRPNEDKLTFSAVFEMTPKGAVKKYWLGKTAIYSNHRFTYEEVQEIIEKETGIYSDEILLLNSIAQRLRKKRFDHGAINFSSTEVRFKLDEKGAPIGIVVKESKESHQLVEEFM